MDEISNESIRQFLSSLMVAANKACDAVIDAKQSDGRFKNSLVNWSKFSCDSTEFYVNNSGNYGRGGFGYRVHIKEVDRDSPELQSFISKELERLGFPDVHVVTEW